MKQINKRTLAWGILTVCVLAAAAFSDDITFVDADSKKAVTADAESDSKDVLKLLLTEDGTNTLKAGVANVTFDTEECESVLLNKTEEGKAGAATLEAMNTPIVTAAQPEVVTEEAVTPWSNKVMANVELQANVRAEASEEAQMVGKLRRGDVADVVEMGEQWTLITSGNVTGYVKNEFLVFGTDAENLANQICKRITTVQADGLNVRKATVEDSDILEQAEAGKEYTCNGEADGWVSINLSSGEIGYVRSEYVTTELRTGTAITIEEEQAAIQAQEEAERKAAEEKAAKEKAAAEKAAKAKAASKATKTQTKATQANVDDLTLLAAVIEMEAGTNYEGGVAVGNVILNRVNSGRFPSSISGVVYQRGQFPGAHNGKLSRILSRGPKSACIQAAQAALNGENYVGGRLYFNSKGSVNYNRISDYVIVGGNCFY